MSHKSFSKDVAVGDSTWFASRLERNPSSMPTLLKQLGPGLYLMCERDKSVLTSFAGKKHRLEDDHKERLLAPLTYELWLARNSYVRVGECGKGM